MKPCPGCGSIVRGPICEVCSTDLSTPVEAPRAESESLWQSESQQVVTAASGAAADRPSRVSEPASPSTATETASPGRRLGALFGAGAAVLVGIVVGVLIASGGGEDASSTDDLVDAPTASAATGPSEPAKSPTTTRPRPVTTTTSVASSTSTSAPPTTPAPTSPPDPNALALLRLVELMDADTAAVAGAAESWVPQLSAKQNGTQWQGVTYDFQAILAEHERLRSEYGALLVDGATYNFRAGGAPMQGWFITIVPEPYSDPSGALGWCTSQRIDSDNCFAKLLTNNQDVGTTIVLNS